MAGRPPQGEESLSSTIRKIFRANPKLLKIRSNATVRELWREAHDGRELPDNFDQCLANVKTSEKKRRKKRGRPPGVATIDDGKPITPASREKKLARLEDEIDNCYTAAKLLEREDLGEVVRMLRHARNKIIIMRGE